MSPVCGFFFFFYSGSSSKSHIHSNCCHSVWSFSFFILFSNSRSINSRQCRTIYKYEIGWSEPNSPLSLGDALSPLGTDQVWVGSDNERVIATASVKVLVIHPESELSLSLWKQNAANECSCCNFMIGFLPNRALSLWRPRPLLSVPRDSSRSSRRIMAVEKDLMPNLQKAWKWG